ncbi:MAG TPA: hypothetical protein VHK88_13025 [Aquihabitans sp.]|jgi:hypothetical protein|nr:hypothetical protein [Aquihabitans sp.]
MPLTNLFLDAFALLGLLGLVLLVVAAVLAAVADLTGADLGTLPRRTVERSARSTHVGPTSLVAR